MNNFVFISYASQDKTIADAICHYLEENGIPCWFAPRDIIPGEKWAGAIVRSIKNCTIMVMIYSEKSNKSSQVANEIDKAFAAGKTIIPFIVDETPMNDDFDYYLSGKHWLVAYPDYKEKLKPLLDAVSAIFPKNDDVHSNKEEDNHTNKVDEITSVSEIVTPKPVNEAPKTVNTGSIVPKWADNVTHEQKTAIEQIISDLVLVEGGILTLGATPEQKAHADSDEYPPHKVELSPYYIDRYTITQKQWLAITGSNPSKVKGDDLPVTDVSLLDCEKFVASLNEMSGLNFGIPTEAQWEFAARGGIKSNNFIFSGSNIFDEVGWNSWDNDEKIRPVGQKKANELGLYDMSGNVGEWCCEKKGKYTPEAVKDPKNHYKASWTNFYVYKGGDLFVFSSSSLSGRVSYRAGYTNDYRSDKIGIRLILTK